MKKLAFGLVGAVLLVILTALVAPSFVDWNQYKGRIADQVRDVTGRDFAIDGDIKMAVLPAPMLALNGVRLANVAKGAAPDMVALDSIEVRIALLPLLSGQVQIETVRLVRPVIELERFAEGPANWQFGSSVSAPATSPAAAPGEREIVAQEASAQFPVRIDAFEVIDGTVRYRDGSGAIEHFEAIDATISAASLIGPFDARGALVARGVPFGFEVSLGKIIQSRTLAFAASVSAGQMRGGGVDEPGVKAKISGSVIGFDGEPKLKGKLSVSGPSLAQLAALVPARAGTQTTVPGVLGREFALTSAVRADGQNLNFDDVELHLGSTRAAGAVQVILAETVDVDVKLAIKSIDLDDWLNAEDVKVKAAAMPVRYRDADQGRTPSARAVLVPRKTTPSKFEFPSNVRATVNVTAGSIAYGQGLMHQAQINLALADGELVINQASAQLPGSTDVAVFGFVTLPNGTPQFDGDIDVTTANLRGLLSWLKLDMPDVPADRLRGISAKAKLVATPTAIKGSDVSIEFDSSKLTGGFALDLGARLSFGLGARLDQLNLDAYLPKLAKTKPAPAAQPRASKPSVAKVNPLAPLKSLTEFDASLDLQVDRMRIFGQTARDLRLDGTLHAGTLQLRDLSVAQYANSSAHISGQVSDLAGVPKAAGVSLAFETSNTAQLFKLAGITPPVPPSGLGAVAVNAQFDGSVLAPKIQARINAAGGEIRLASKVRLLDLLTGVRVDLSLSHPDLYALTRSLALGYTPAKTVGGITLNARLIGDGGSFESRNVQGTIGKTVFSATLGVTNLGLVGRDAPASRPVVSVELNFDKLDIDPYLPADVRAKNKAAKQRRRDVASGKQSSAGRKTAGATRWSREPFDLSALTAVDGSIAVVGNRLRYDRFRFSNFKLDATLRGGVLDVSRLTGELFSGRFDGVARISAPAQTVTGRINLRDAQMGDMQQAATAKRSAEGVFNLDLNCSASGTSEFDLVSSLGGSGRFALTGIALKDKDGSGSAAAGLLNLLGAMNTMAGGFLIDQGGSKDGTSSLKGTFNAQNGVVRSTDMRLVTPMGRGVATATVTLPKWILDARGEVQMKRNLLTALLGSKIRLPDVVPFSVSGPLDAPNVTFGTQRSSAPTAAPKPVPSTGVGASELQRRKTTTSQPPPLEPKKVDPAGLLNQLFKKKLF